MNYIKYKVKNFNQTGGSNTPDINYNNELFIFEDFFSNNDFNSIKNTVKNIKFKDDKRVSSRKTLCLNSEGYPELYNMIYNNPKMKSIIQKINSKPFNKIPRFPIEYRIYPEGSKGMNWHIDTSLFSPDAIEGVITIDNQSPSKFKWKEGLLTKNISPKSNTVAFVKPGTVLHSVSGTEDGYRTIIKFVIDFKDSKPRHAFHKELKNCPY
jgi:hypothetical protein